MFRRLRHLARQVLQLLITAMAWAAGLGLVTGSIVLVATATAPSSINAARRADGNALPRLTPHMANSPDYRVLATFSGHGNRTTQHFKVKAKMRWQLQWAYRCGPQAAQFELQRADMGPDRATIRITIEDFAASGHGSAWLRAAGHRHYLKVVSACSWSVKVVQAV